MTGVETILQQASYRRNGAPVYGAPDMAQTAVLVMNMQLAWVSETGPFRGVLPNQDRRFYNDVRSFVERARRAGARIIWCKTVTGPRGSADYWATYFDNFVGPENRDTAVQALMSQSPLQQLHPMFEVSTEDWVLDKTRFDAFLGTELGPKLQADRRTGVVATGTATNICCESTIRSAMCRDFKTWMPHDLVSAPTEDGHLAGLRSVAQSFADISGLL